MSFKDGLELEFDTEGTYSGVLVSELEVRTKVTCVDVSELVSGKCPGDLSEEIPAKNCRFRPFQNVLKTMLLPF